MYFDAALTTLVNDNIYHNGDKYYMDPDCSIELVMNTVDNVSQPVQPENVTASTSMHEEPTASRVTGHELQTIDTSTSASLSQS